MVAEPSKRRKGEEKFDFSNVQHFFRPKILLLVRVLVYLSPFHRFEIPMYKFLTHSISDKSHGFMLLNPVQQFLTVVSKIFTEIR